MERLKRFLILMVVMNLLLSLMVFAVFAADEVVAGGSCGSKISWTLSAGGVLTISGTGPMEDYNAYEGTPFAQIAADVKKVIIQEGVTRIGTYSFYQCVNMTTVSIPDTVSAVGNYAFDHCTSLTQVTLPPKVTQIGDHTFHGCTSLTEVVLPQGVQTIGESAFSDCTGLTKMTLPDSLTTIGERAFFNCENLTQITLSARVAKIDVYAFAWCRRLEKIWFYGNAPTFGAGCFWETAATAYYPMDDATWTREVLQNYDGSITWIQGSYTCGHGETVLKAQTSATCTKTGYTGDTHCAHCGKLLEKGRSIPKTDHSWSAEGVCAFCGKPEGNLSVTRLAGAHRFDTAFLAADQMKKTLGVEKFDTVVVASGMDFADALSGSYLAAVKNAPILLASQVESINDLVKTYIKENLRAGGTVYILGGISAVPASFAEGLGDFAVTRLAGDNRFQTNLRVLEEAGVGDKPILVCTGLGFADSLSASAAKQPILLVYGKELLEEQKKFLRENCRNVIYVIGGTGAVSEKLEAALFAYSDVERLAGADRFATSALIAERFFAAPKKVVLAYAANFPDGLCGGPLAAAMDAPLILTMKKYEQQAADYIQGESIRQGIILGGDTLIPDASVNKIF